VSEPKLPELVHGATATTVLVKIPKGSEPGEILDVAVPGHRRDRDVAVPPGAKAGQKLAFAVPVAPQPHPEPDAGLQVLFNVPAEGRAGDVLEIAVPGHRTREVTVPENARPGQELSFTIGPHAKRVRGLGNQISTPALRAALDRLIASGPGHGTDILAMSPWDFAENVLKLASGSENATTWWDGGGSRAPAKLSKLSSDEKKQATGERSAGRGGTAASGGGGAAAAGQDDYGPLISAIKGLISGAGDEAALKAAVEGIVAKKIAAAEEAKEAAAAAKREAAAAAAGAEAKAAATAVIGNQCHWKSMSCEINVM